VLALQLAAGGAATALDAPTGGLSPLAVRAWRIADGLPQDTVNCAARTPDGFLWLGTEEGLVRFDGSQMRVYARANTPSMPNHNVQALLASRDGALLVGTYGGGLLRIRDGEVSPCTGGGALLGSRVQALAETADGVLWVATSRSLLRLDGCDVARVVAPFALEDADVRSLAVDGSGGLWIGTWGRGVLRIPASGPPTELRVADGLPSNTVMSLVEEPGRGMWIGTSNGPALVAGAGPPDVPFHEVLGRLLVWDMLPDGDGGLWLASTEGLFRLTADGVERTGARALHHPLVARCLIAADGALWVGSVGSGLLRFAAGTFTVADLSAGRRVATLAHRHRGGAWLGTADGEVYRSDGVKSVALGLGAALRGSEVRALWEGRDGTLWIGTWLGLYRWRDGRINDVGRSMGLEGRVVRSVMEDSRGVLWVGTDGGGVLRGARDGARRITIEDGLAGDQVRDFFEDREGTVWIATYGGLSAVRDGGVSSLTTADGLPSDLVRTLFEDDDGTLWIGTYGGGLGRLRGGRLAAVTTREGLASDVIYAIVDDGHGSLWMGGTRGLFRVAKDELAAVAEGRADVVHSVVYGEGDGLPSGEAYGNSRSALRSEDGRLWFATVSGLVLADGTAARMPRSGPRVVVDDVVADGTRLARRGTVEVPPGTRRLEIAYAGIRLAPPGPLRFRFRLAGWDRAWVDAGERRSAIYTRLPPGFYRFEVTAQGLDGQAAEGVSAVRLRVKPLPWQTGWFLALAAAAVVLAAAALHRARVRRLQARERELSSRVEEELKRVRVLQGLIPICAGCKKIRDDAGYWTQLEEYIREHSEADFTHGFCPECLERLYGEWFPDRFPRKLGAEADEAD